MTVGLRVSQALREIQKNKDKKEKKGQGKSMLFGCSEPALGQILLVVGVVSQCIGLA